jgi:hypothetical protein
MRKRLIILATIYLVAFPSAGTTLERMSLARLTHSAQWVVRARCRDNNSDELAPAGSAGIWTVTDFDVEESWKGQPSSHVQVRLPGGRAGHAIRLVLGAPRFHAGEEVVLFLERTHTGNWSITAWGEGTFRIRYNSKDEEIATPDIASGDSSKANSKNNAADSIKAMPVAELRAQVRQAALSSGDLR